MRIYRRLAQLFSLVASATTFAAGPESLAGFVYYQSGNTIARTSYQLGVVLQSDGTYRGIYGATTTIAGTSLFNYSPPEDGRWNYRRIEENSAELTLTQPA
jgi:hypothetical protein